jgi:hypothetical protein
MSFSEDPTRGVGTGGTPGEDPMGTGRPDVMLDPMQGVRPGATSGEDPLGTGRPDVTLDPTQGAQADEQPHEDPTEGAQSNEQSHEDPTQGSEPEASPAIPTHAEISVRAYFIHLEAPESDDLGNWLRAERELTPV